jgi:hypothetical protein
MSRATDVVRWDGRKWPDRQHWQFAMERLGSDAHGQWFSVPAGAEVRRGDEPVRMAPHGCVLLVPPGTWWTVEFYWDHPLHSIYVNIGTPCEASEGAIRQVDLDLDVVRTRDGRVQILDEDEFAVHQKLYGYPPDLIESARHAADAAALLIKDSIEPFGLAAEHWMLRAKGLD